MDKLSQSLRTHPKLIKKLEERQVNARMTYRILVVLMVKLTVTAIMMMHSKEEYWKT